MLTGRVLQRAHTNHCCCGWKACTGTCSASGGACSNGLSPKFTRYRPNPDNAGDKKMAAMLLNAAPLGAAKLPLTAAPLNMPPRAVPHVDAKPMTSPTAHALP